MMEHSKKAWTTSTVTKRYSKQEALIYDSAMQIPATAVRAKFHSPLGLMHLMTLDSHLIGVWFDAQAHQPDLHHVAVTIANPVTDQAKEQLSEYFAGRRQRFSLPVRFVFGTLFQQAVWKALQKIPLGQSATYLDIALGLGKPEAARAVGAAVGRNPLSIVIPCHRVLGAQGKMTGYAGGLDRKAALLRLEGLI